MHNPEHWCGEPAVERQTKLGPLFPGCFLAAHLRVCQCYRWLEAKKLCKFANMPGGGHLHAHPELFLELRGDMKSAASKMAVAAQGEEKEGSMGILCESLETIVFLQLRLVKNSRPL